MNQEHQRPRSSSAWVVRRHLPGVGLPVVPQALQTQSPPWESRKTSAHAVPVRGCQHPMKVQLEATCTSEVVTLTGNSKTRSEPLTVTFADAGAADAVEITKRRAARTNRSTSHLRIRVEDSREAPADAAHGAEPIIAPRQRKGTAS